MSRLSDLLSLFRRKPTDGSGAPALQPGRRIYAIGDIHGFADRLDALLGMIVADLAASSPVEAEAVFLGDYIDRGPDSAAVLDRLARRDIPLPFVSLRGNHEALLLDVLADPAGMAHWCRSGGDATLASYDIDISPHGSGKALTRAHKALLERMPEPHRRFLADTALHYVAGPYTFVHAGLRPGVPLDQQSEDDLLWIRDAFFRSAHSYDGVVVHGHTPRPRPENETHRINVDTGVFKYGILTCVVLDGAERRFLSTRD